MELTIKQADNGFVLSYFDKEIKETRHIAVEDVAEGMATISDARITQKLLWEIMEYFGLFTSKHDDERLRIVLEDRSGKEIE